MNKSRFIALIAIGLLVANLLLVSFILCHKPHHRRHPEPREIIQHELHFDKTQTRKYAILIQQHQHEMKTVTHQLMRLKNQLYGSLGDDKTTINKDSLMEKIAKAHLKIEEINYHHFQKIKTLCNVDQLKYFNSLSKKIAHLFGPPPPMKHKKEND